MSIVNQTELAEIIGVSDVTLWEWGKLDLPLMKRGERGEANQYDTAAVIAWMVTREVAKVSSESQKDRLTRLQADKLARENAREDGILVSVTEVEPLWQSQVLSAAAYLQGQPSRLAGILEATPGLEPKRELLKREFAEFLTRLGVDGERMQAQVEELLAKLSTEEAAAFLTRIASPDDLQSNTNGPH